MSWLDNNSILLTQKSLDYTWQKQKVISENVANVSTPGYKAKYVTFEDELMMNLGLLSGKDNMKASKIKEQIEMTNIKTHINTSESTRLDGNNVNVDVENMELARTQLQYEFLLRQVADQFTRMKTVIEGR